jgi:DnaK suppressor protein
MARILKEKKRFVGKKENHRSRVLQNLTTKKEEVQKTLGRLMEEQKEYSNLTSDDYLIEEMDHAGREISSQTHYILLERKNKELEKIKSLIERASEDEEFGLCEECDEKIPEARLVIMPEATRCVPCQQELEKSGSRSGFIESPRTKLGGKKDLHWGTGGDSDDIGKLRFKPDFDSMSFLDSDDFDLGDNSGFNTSSESARASTG